MTAGSRSIFRAKAAVLFQIVRNTLGRIEGSARPRVSSHKVESRPLPQSKLYMEWTEAANTLNSLWRCLSLKLLGWSKCSGPMIPPASERPSEVAIGIRGTVSASARWTMKKM